MKFWEAMKLVEEGAKVRRSRWAEVSYIAKGSEFPYTVCHFQDGKFVGWWTPDVWDMTALDWEIHTQL